MEYASEYIRIRRETESARCLLCYQAPCQEACPSGVDIAGLIRSLRFENLDGAIAKRGGDCSFCNAPCMNVCLRKRIDRPVDIRTLVMELPEENPEQAVQPEADLTVHSMGITFENPFLLSSSIVGSNYEMIAKAFDMGWAGVAFKTIGMFVPEETSPRFSTLSKESNPFLGFKNIEQISDHTLEENIGYIRRLKRNYPEKIILASIMGRDDDEWTYLAEKMEEAGADAIECNFSCPHMSGSGLGSDVGTHPDLVARYTRAVRRGTSLPILAKMTPNITSMELPAEAAVEAGADGLAAINTIKSVMNVDLHSFVSAPAVTGKSAVGGYSGKAVKPIALRFIQDLRRDPKLEGAAISGMGGIETWRDAAEFIALGCETVQVTTAVMQYGYRIIDDLKDGLVRYLTAEGFSSVEQLVGRAIPNLVNTDELDRHSIAYPAFHSSKCIGCGRCYISCFDGGHQAIHLNPANGKAGMDPGKCVGCELCMLVCPVHAITEGKRRVSVKQKAG
jgi:dihydropyrimidine dehydrogenase (NAD+) subunit PreA